MASATIGTVLYENSGRSVGATGTYSTTIVPGYEPENCFDWRDFSSFLVASASTTSLDLTFGTAQTVDTWSVFTRQYDATGGAAIILKYESAPAVFTTVDTVSIAAGTAALTLRQVTPFTVAVGRKLRFEFMTNADDFYVRQLVTGQRLEFPIGQHGGITPPNLQQGVVVDNVIAVNGSLIGRNKRRFERTSSIKLDYLDPAWVRTYWEPFVTHAIRYPFIYAWNLATYSAEVVFAAADNIVAPENMPKRGKMRVSMPLKAITTAG